jgi:predicted nucleic acid-binding Zn ribbon protein
VKLRKKMPNYEYENTNTGERFFKLSSWDDSQKILEENPDLRRVIGAPKIVGGVGTNLKVDDGFREVISKVKQTYKVNNIKDY